MQTASSRSKIAGFTLRGKEDKRDFKETLSHLKTLLPNEEARCQNMHWKWISTLFISSHLVSEHNKKPVIVSNWYKTLQKGSKQEKRRSQDLLVSSFFYILSQSLETVKLLSIFLTSPRPSGHVIRLLGVPWARFKRRVDHTSPFQPITPQLWNERPTSVLFALKYYQTHKNTSGHDFCCSKRLSFQQCRNTASFKFELLLSLMTDLIKTKAFSEASPVSVHRLLQLVVENKLWISKHKNMKTLVNKSAC